MKEHIRTKFLNYIRGLKQGQEITRQEIMENVCVSDGHVGGLIYEAVYTFRLLEKVKHGVWRRTLGKV